MKITFLGAGVFGTALANIASQNQHIVKFYDPFKFPEVALKDALADAEVVVYTAPSDQASEILPQLNPETPLICASKGFLSLEPFLKFQSFSVLSGAAFAEDIEKQRNITFTVTSKLAQDIFSTTNIKTELVSDALGILLCGTLKNIYAIGAGFDAADNTSAATSAAAQTAADNTSAATQTAINSYPEIVAPEFAEILRANHVNPDILQYSCGLADLTLTCSPRSRNFCFGRALKLGETPETGTIEGVAAIHAIEKTPTFVLPADAKIIREIIKTVKEGYATK